MSRTISEMEAAKNELRALGASGFIDRSSNLWQLLEYVCNKYFEGEAEQLKEYNIAVDVFDRGPEFDKKRDSIVRVEAHRLRRRLQQYYAGEGAEHALHIIIPPGHYAPRFVARGADVSVADTPVTPERRPPGLGRRLAIPVSIGLLTLIAAGYWYEHRPASVNSPGVASANSFDRGGAAPAPGEVIRITAGSRAGRQIDSMGRSWSADTYFTDGEEATAPFRSITRTKDPTIYLRRREGSFRYDIPLKPGWYEMRLFFAEPTYGSDNVDGGGESSRLFRILVNGKIVEDYFDVIADAPGPNMADAKVYRGIQQASDGFLHLQFVSQKDRAFVNGIEIVEGDQTRLRPIRMVARESAYTDSRGILWLPDTNARGGRLAVRQQEVAGETDPGITQGERYGNFSYSIPVAPGRYTVILHFAETWYGPDRPGGGGAGSRSFNVYCNGTALLRNFDVFKEAGGSFKALEKKFAGLQANAQGKLDLSFVPERNYALVNAIEVLDEGSQN